MPVLTPIGLSNYVSRDHGTSVEERMALESMVSQAIERASASAGVGKNLAFAIVSAHDQSPALHPEETRILNRRACEQKQAEWIAGRSAARLAVEQLGAEDPAILRGDAGEPLWPDGVSGSITHCYPWSIAVAAKNSYQAPAIGIDLESIHRMRRADPAAIVDLICREPEREWILGGSDAAERLTIIFSAKEALYKSLYPLCKRYIDFKEVELTWSRYKSCFHTELIANSAGDLAFLQGHEVSCQQYRHLFLACSIHRTA